MLINIKKHILKDVQMIVQKEVSVIHSMVFANVIQMLLDQIVVNQLKQNVQVIVMEMDNVLMISVNVKLNILDHLVVSNLYVEMVNQVVQVGVKQDIVHLLINMLHI
jgi:hypothetical protein